MSAEERLTSHVERLEALLDRLCTEKNGDIHLDESVWSALKHGSLEIPHYAYDEFREERREPECYPEASATTNIAAAMALFRERAPEEARWKLISDDDGIALTAEAEHQGYTLNYDSRTTRGPLGRDGPEVTLSGVALALTRFTLALTIARLRIDREARTAPEIG